MGVLLRSEAEPAITPLVEQAWSVNAIEKMEHSIHCLRCDTPMEEGFVMDVAHGATHVARWVAGPPERSFWTGTKTRDREKRAITTYRCPKCGYLESYAREISD